jgi:Protein of unknown function (DUF1036)
VIRSVSSLWILSLLLGLFLVWQVDAQPRPPGPAGPSSGDGVSSRDFQLQICSHIARQGEDIYVATAAAALGEGQATANGGTIDVQGWWKIPVNQCVNIGHFPRPGIFAYAMAQNGQVFWSNPEPQLCVNLQAKFDYKFNPDVGRSCTGAETLKGFFAISIDANSISKKFTLNWN